MVRFTKPSFWGNNGENKYRLDGIIMKEFSRPRVVISKCLGFEACRYNGEIISEPLVDRLRTFVEVITVCPEVAIGLGTPRPPIKVVAQNPEYRLIQPETGRDLTKEMEDFSSSFLGTLPEVEGFILKSRSPSCGLRDTKIFSPGNTGAVLKKASGLFGKKVLENYGHLAVEDEGRLKNYIIREHFLIKLFTLAQFNSLKKEKSMQKLVKFQSDNKYLFMAYNQIKQKELGRIVANPDKNSTTDVYTAYETRLFELLKAPASYGSNINVLQHIMGYFSKELSLAEKSFFISLIEKYRMAQVPLSSPVGVLRSWAFRFNSQYLLDQTFFEPYPQQLLEITDSGKGRDYS